MNSNLAARLISAAVTLPVVFYLLHVGGWWCFGFFVIAGIITLQEYTSIVSDDPFERRVTVMIAAVVLSLSMLVERAADAVVLSHGASVALCIVFTLRTGDMKTTWTRMSTLAFGMVYISLAVGSFYRLRVLGNSLENSVHTTWILIVLLAGWGNDTFAYFAGRAFGKTKLYEKVSPKKTWEGFFGGGIGALGAMFLIRFTVGDTYFGDVTVIDILCIGIPAMALGPLGDLAESLMKRSYNTKDSGGILPGHGGLLDRVDATFFIAPWALFYVTTLRPLLAG